MYLVSYGLAGDFGRFQSAEPLACQRGDLLVVRTPRGQEMGTVRREATSGHDQMLTDHFVGEILRPATQGDRDLAERMRQRGRSLFQESRRLAQDLALPLEILDAEVLLDGRQGVLHHLRWAECDPRALMDPLARQFRLLVTLHDLSLPASKPDPEEEPTGCGTGGCGSAGGCGSCQQGACTSCTSHRHAADLSPTRRIALA